MATSAFEYTATDTSGKTSTGVLMAVDELDLDRQLEGRGLTLTKARHRKSSARGGRAKLTREELINFTTQLATVTGAGVPIVDGLNGIGQRMESEGARTLIGELVAGLEGGDGLSEVMKPYERAFPDVYRASVRAGESAGALDSVLFRLARYLDWARQMRATTIQALIYPGILLCAISGLIFVMLYFVLPKILKLFPGGRDTLPAQTQNVLAASDFVRENILALAFAGVLAGVGWVWAMKRPGPRAFVHTLLLRLPKVGRVAQKIATSKFASTAATLQSAGCDIFHVLQISSETCGNTAMSNAFQRATDRVRKGETISAALEKEPLVDPLLVQLVSVGEKSGNLDGCLERLVAYYDDEVPRAVKKFLALLEPAMLLSAGMIVAYILLAALMPIFQLYENMG